MKSTFLFAILLILFHISRAQFDNPTDYNNAITDMQHEIVSANVRYISFVVHSDDEAAVARMRKENVALIENSIAKLKKMKGYQGDDELKNDAQAVFEQFLETYKFEFNEAEVLKETSQESFEAMEAYLAAVDKANDKLEVTNEQMKKAQAKFAKKYNFQIVEGKASEINERIALIGEVSDYDRKIFLIFFKSLKDEGRFMDALAEGDVKKMEKERKMILVNADQAIKDLKLIKPFNQDAAYREETLKYIQYLKNVAEKEFDVFVKVLRKEESDRTQGDIDKFNEAVDYINEHNQIYNQAYNEARTQFLRRHIPAE